MAWIRYSGDNHECNTPYLDLGKWKDIWKCDKCGKLWRKSMHRWWAPASRFWLWRNLKHE